MPFSVALLLSLAPAPPPAAVDHFEARVRPVLAEKCVRCHGPEKQSGGLRLDSQDALLKGGDSGPAAVAGKPAESLLVQAIRRADGVSAMPPDKPLDAATLLAFERWVADGLPWPAKAAAVTAARHWAFQPVRVVKPPAPGHPVDAFLAASGRKPAPPAAKLALLRRATFDLTGLPPTPEEADTFLKDEAPGAFARVVDRLLACPHYGEKWGRMWLDVARYADTAGETADYPVPDARRYRDYVIAAFNADTPYDRFVTEQLAGDILAARLPADAPPARYAELVAATGYLAVARRFGYDTEKDHFLTIEDTIDTVGKGLLGLTVGCARCHDHKYDAISANDYYALYGIFESTCYPQPGSEKDPKRKDLVALLPPKAADDLRSGVGGVVGFAATVSVDRIGPTAYAVAEGNPHDAQFHLRGDPDARGPAVPRRFLQALGGQPVPKDGGSGRLALAGWITDPKNPLTARVMVNRLWQGHFGTGLVATANDFGTRGTPPTHPELLDWLTGEFVRSGWSVKALHRTIMLSQAYQQAAGPDGFARRRLAAEEIRDSLLAVSGLLDRTPAGPHPFPAPKTWRFTQHAPFAAVYETDRRSVYLMTTRLKRHPFLALFDGPDPNSSTAGRQTTTVPTQALFFLNDPLVHRCADRLAAELVKLPDDAARVDQACRLLYGRPGRDRDREVAARFLGGRTDAAAWAGWVRVLFGTNELVYVD